MYSQLLLGLSIMLAAWVVLTGPLGNAIEHQTEMNRLGSAQAHYLIIQEGN